MPQQCNERQHELQNRKERPCNTYKSSILVPTNTILAEWRYRKHQDHKIDSRNYQVVTFIFGHQTTFFYLWTKILKNKPQSVFKGLNDFAPLPGYPSATFVEDIADDIKIT